MQPVYKRVLLKLSGEALAGDQRFGLNHEVIAPVVEQIVELHNMGVQVGLVIGGGNFWRGRQGTNMDRTTADHMGMLAAAVLGLILPAVEYGGAYGLPIVVVGVFVGAICLNLTDRLVPHLHKLSGGVGEEAHRGNERINKVLLFVLAIAIHNLPEGIAAGVGFGSGNTAEALLIAGGIALQNIPEGMVIIAPMLSAGIKPKKTFLYASLTGLVEVVGTLIGYFAVSLASAILPFALAFAGGTMLYVISDEMIPETHAHGSERGATYALLFGFCLMLVFDILLG